MFIDEDGIELADDIRVRVLHDEDAQNPRDEDTGVYRGGMFYTIERNRSRYVALGDVDEFVVRAYDRFRETLSSYEAAETLERYLNIYHGGGTVIEGTVNAREGLDVIAYALHSDIEEVDIPHAELILMSEVAESWAWGEGEMYVFILEKRRTYLPEDGEGDPLYKWEQIDAIGGCYVDLWDEAEVKDIIEGHFGWEVEV